MNYPSEVQEKMEAIRKFNTAPDGSICGATRRDAIGAMPQRDKAPVEMSVGRLFERIGQLQAEVDQLTDRLAPVSRLDSTGSSACSDRSPSECQMVEMLDSASERIEATISRIVNARARLCI